MDSPPRKRQRRAVILDSDDEEASAAESQLSTTSLNVTTKSLSIRNGSRTATSPKKQTGRKPASIPKTKSKATKSAAAKSSTSRNNSTIYNFFNNATPNGSQGTVRQDSPDISTPVSDEVVEEISSDDDRPIKAGNGLHRKKLVRTSSTLSQTFSLNGEPATVTKAKQFSSVGSQVAAPAATQSPSSQGSWLDLYPPENLDELVVHKKKVADVHKWLDNVLHGRERKRLLVLKGPAGSGKTATLRLLAKEIGRRLIEWENPVGSSYDSDGFVSLAAQFDDFLTRIIKFQGLELSDTGGGDKVDENAAISNSIILLEDFPNTFSRGSTALLNFRDSILRYLAASTPPLGSRASELQITPVVMIVSETHLSNSSDYKDSFTVNKLLGPQLLQHPSVAVIAFNAIAPTLLTKALTTTLKKENKIRKKPWKPNPDVLKQISQSGDIRASINSLQLACLFDQTPSSLSSKSSSKSNKKSDLPPIPPLQSSISFRTDIIELFHAAGKILYNKRLEPSPSSEPLVQPPPHLNHLSRPKESEVSISQLYADIGTDIDTFISTLHENYPSSCFGEDFLDSADDSMSMFSDADLLLSSGLAQPFARGGASAVQAEYAFNTASRGLLFYLPFPVERGKTLSSLLKINRDPFKMVYPAGLKFWRVREENEGIVDDWTDYFLRSDGQEGGGVLKRLGRGEMGCEVLPWIGKIIPGLAMANVNGNGKGKTALAAMDEADEDGDDSTATLGSSLVMPLPPTAGHVKKQKAFRFGEESPEVQKMQSLVLSDDDIEDD